MPNYEYKCPTSLCNYRTTSTERGNRLYQECPQCHYPQLHRVFGFLQTSTMQEHFNHSVMEPVSSMRGYTDILKRRSEEAFLHTGIEHDFKPLEWGDAQAFGATNEGIHESNVERSRIGAPLLPEIPN